LVLPKLVFSFLAVVVDRLQESLYVLILAFIELSQLPSVKGILPRRQWQAVNPPPFIMPSLRASLDSIDFIDRLEPAAQAVRVVIACVFRMALALDVSIPRQ
jgi:hypothetical protein